MMAARNPPDLGPQAPPAASHVAGDKKRGEGGKDQQSTFGPRICHGENERLTPRGPHDVAWATLGYLIQEGIRGCFLARSTESQGLLHPSQGTLGVVQWLQGADPGHLLMGWGGNSGSGLWLCGVQE